MTSAEYPDQQPNQPSLEGLLGDFRETEEALDILLINLHESYLEAAADDAAAMAGIAAMSILGPRTSRDYLVRPGLDTDVMNPDYKVVSWAPNPDTPTARRVRQIEACYPKIVVDPDVPMGINGSRTPEDVCLKIYFKRRGMHMYLVNKDGIFPYRDGTRDIIVDEESANSDDPLPSVMKCVRINNKAPKLTPDDINKMVFDDSNCHAVHAA